MCAHQGPRAGAYPSCCPNQAIRSWPAPWVGPFSDVGASLQQAPVSPFGACQAPSCWRCVHSPSTTGNVSV
jgi:hypothetical protein